MRPGLETAVVGYGWWGRTIVGLLERSSLKVVRVAESNPSVQGPAGIALSRDFDSILEDPGVKAVVLCTPHSQHAGQIVAAARAGKHVFCEKPLSLTRADAKRAIDACRDAGVALAVGHERRFEPPVLELQRLVREGALGTPLQVEANFSQDKFLAMAADNWRLSPREAPAGPLTATGIHLLDLSVSVLGAPARAYASVRRLGSALVNGDTLAALVSFESGAHALISAILATPFVGRFAVFGNKGWAEIRDKTHPEAPEGWTLTTCLRGGRPEARDYPATSGVLANLEAFAEAASGGAPYPVPHGEMLANIAALEAIVRSAASGRPEDVEKP